MPLLARNCTIKTISAAFFVAGSVKARGRLQKRNEFNVRYQAATLMTPMILWSSARVKALHSRPGAGRHTSPLKKHPSLVLKLEWLTDPDYSRRVYVPRLKKRTALLVKVKTVVQRHRSHMPSPGSDLLENRTFVSGVTAAECRTGLCD